MSRVFLGLFAVAALLYGCGSNPPVALVSTDTSLQTHGEAQPGPPKCKGQAIIAHSAQVDERVPRNGATLCVPSFRGFGGYLGFPGVHPGPQPIKLIVTVPRRDMKLDNRNPIFNLEWLPGEQFTFGKTAPPGGISGVTITPGQTYTGSGVIYFKASHKNVGPCYSVATRGKYGGVFNDLGTLMEKQPGPFLVWDLTIYAGKEAKSKC
jgi:hypothetical protein